MKITLTVTGRRTADGDTEITEVKAEGLMRRTPTGWELRWRQEEDGLRVDTIARVGDGQLEVERRGGASSLMRLRVGETLHTEYDTGFGVLQMATTTHRVEHRLSESGGYVRTAYRLEINGVATADHELDIQILSVVG